MTRRSSITKGTGRLRLTSHSSAHSLLLSPLASSFLPRVERWIDGDSKERLSSVFSSPLLFTHPHDRYGVMTVTLLDKKNLFHSSECILRKLKVTAPDGKESLVSHLQYKVRALSLTVPRCPTPPPSLF